MSTSAFRRFFLSTAFPIHHHLAHGFTVLDISGQATSFWARICRKEEKRKIKVSVPVCNVLCISIRYRLVTIFDRLFKNKLLKLNLYPVVSCTMAHISSIVQDGLKECIYYYC